MLHFRMITSALVVVFCFFITGCGEKAPAEVLTEEGLKNAEYRSQYYRFSKVKLKEGEYRSSASGPASKNVVRYKKALVGTFNGKPMAVVMLTGSSGKIDSFYELALMDVREGRLRNIAGYILGDQIKISDFRLEKERIIVAMTTHGPKDPPCCPTQKVQKIFEIKSGGLVQVKTVQSAPAKTKKSRPAPLPPKSQKKK